GGARRKDPVDVQREVAADAEVGAALDRAAEARAAQASDAGAERRDGSALGEDTDAAADMRTQPAGQRRVIAGADQEAEIGPGGGAGGGPDDARGDGVDTGVDRPGRPDPRREPTRRPGPPAP